MSGPGLHISEAALLVFYEGNPAMTGTLIPIHNAERASFSCRSHVAIHPTKWSYFVSLELAHFHQSRADHIFWWPGDTGSNEILDINVVTPENSEFSKD